MKAKKRIRDVVYHVIVFGIGILMIYPLIWMFMSSFKETKTIFQTAGSLIPNPFTLDNYINGLKGFAKVPFLVFFKNSLFISIVATIGTVISSAVVAYGFARFDFKGKKILFAAMLLSMMLPAQVLMIPQYLWYNKLGWINTYSEAGLGGKLLTADCAVFLCDSGIFRLPDDELYRRNSEGTGRGGQDRRLFLPADLRKSNPAAHHTGPCYRRNLLLYVEMG